MALYLVNRPQNEPYTLDEAKRSWRISIDEDDSLIEALITASREYAEITCRLTILTTTYMLTLDRFPYHGSIAGWHQPTQPLYYGTGQRHPHHGQQIALPRSPLQRVVQVTYLDEASVLQTLDPAKYGVDTGSRPGRLYLLQGQSWPSTLHQPEAVRVEFECGWPSQAEIPRTLLAALKLLGGHMYEAREGTTEKPLTAIPYGIDCLLALHRVIEADS